MIENNGLISWTGPGRIYNYGYHTGYRATINNRAGGTFSLLSDGQVFLHDYNASWFNNDAGGLLVKNGGSGSTLLSNFILTSGGDIRVEQGELLLAGISNLEDGSRFMGEGSTRITGSATLSGSAAVDSTRLELSSGSLLGPVDALSTIATSGSGRFIWSGGSLNGVMAFAAGADVGFEGASSKVFGAGAVLNNSGRITWSEGNLYNNGYHVVNRATINNLSGGFFQATGSGMLAFDYNPSFVSNEAGATFEKSGAGTTTTSNWVFDNKGVIDVIDGAATFNRGLTLGPSSVLKFAIRGVTPNEHFGRISVAGQFTPAGGVVGWAVNGFVPGNGDTFSVIGFGSRAGEFGSATMTGLGTGLACEADYQASGFSLVVVEQQVPVPFVFGPSSMLPDGTFRTTLTGPPAASCRIETSLDLINWTTIQTVTPFEGNYEVSHSGAGQDDRRFYRAVIE